MDTPLGPYVSFEGLADVSTGRPLHHGVLAHAVGVLWGPDHVGHELQQPVVGEGVVRPRHIHLHERRCCSQAAHVLTSGPRVPPVLPCRARPLPALSKPWGD